MSCHSWMRGGNPNAFAVQTDNIEDNLAKKQKEQVTRGHNIVADGWAGAANPHPHPRPHPTPFPTQTHTQKEEEEEKEKKRNKL